MKFFSSTENSFYPISPEKKSMLAGEALLAKKQEQEAERNEKEKSENEAVVAKALTKKSPAVIFPEAA